MHKMIPSKISWVIFLLFLVVLIIAIFGPESIFIYVYWLGLFLFVFYFLMMTKFVFKENSKIFNILFNVKNKKSDENGNFHEK